MWLFQACLRSSLPVRVTRMRSAMPLRVLSLGTLGGLLGFRGGRPGGVGRGLVAGGQDHEQVAALHYGSALYDGDLLGRVRDPVEQPPPDVLVDHLAAPEHDRHLDLLALLQKLPHALELRLEVVVRHLRPQLHLLELDDVLPPPLVLLALDALELEPTVVQQPANWRARLRGDLHQIEALFARDPLRRIKAQDTQLVVLVVDQTNLLTPDLVIDPELFKRDGALPL